MSMEESPTALYGYNTETGTSGYIGGFSGKPVQNPGGDNISWWDNIKEHMEHEYPHMNWGVIRIGVGVKQTCLTLPNNYSGLEKC